MQFLEHFSNISGSMHKYLMKLKNVSMNQITHKQHNKEDSLFTVNNSEMCSISLYTG